MLPPPFASRSSSLSWFAGLRPGLVVSWPVGLALWSLHPGGRMPSLPVGRPPSLPSLADMWPPVVSGSSQADAALPLPLAGHSMPSLPIPRGQLPPLTASQAAPLADSVTATAYAPARRALRGLSPRSPAPRRVASQQAARQQVPRQLAPSQRAERQQAAPPQIVPRQVALQQVALQQVPLQQVGPQQTPPQAEP